MQMHKSLRILQLNVHKRDTVHQSLMNDSEIREFGALAVSEPHAQIIDDMVITSPMGHSNWTKMIPTTRREKSESRWPIRSMLWIRSDIEAEQIRITQHGFCFLYVLSHFPQAETVKTQFIQRL